MSSSFFAALYSAFGKYDVVHIHAEGPAFFSWLPKMFGKRVVVTIHGIDWQREKWRSGFGSKFIRQGEKNAVKYADEIIVLSKGVQDYFKDTYGRETHFIPNGVNRPEIREANVNGQYKRVILDLDPSYWDNDHKGTFGSDTNLLFRLTGNRWVDYIKNILMKDNYNDTFADYNLNTAMVKRIPQNLKCKLNKAYLSGDHL